ncbi:hypothetical protein [Pseudomonas fluorescens]|uniref:Bacterial Ig-like domain-containing protein n=1 Tax=Pseudomonas fluorescens TaxID=294 RepID=A0A5E7CEU7_PSEFL|nr:hypothetical protein [Pseudomonas fluorescens]VVN94273.1 hypothetical protein PS710_02138 [Pseudomonas fluorescens]
MKSPELIKPAPPVITIPQPNADTGTVPLIAGSGVPGCIVTVAQVTDVETILNKAPVGADGGWSLKPLFELAEGSVQISAWQNDGVDDSEKVHGYFRVVKVQPPPPHVQKPVADYIAGPATLLQGVGVPNAFVQVWNLEQTQLLGEGDVDGAGRWVFSVKENLSEGLYEIRARQTYLQQTSEWTAPLAFNVVRQLPVNAPIIVTPGEGAKVESRPMFSGEGQEPGYSISVVDLATNNLIAFGLVHENGQWSLQSSVALPAGPNKISALQRFKSDTSDWALVRSFEVGTT